MRRRRRRRKETVPHFIPYFLFYMVSYCNYLIIITQIIFLYRKMLSVSLHRWHVLALLHFITYANLIIGELGCMEHIKVKFNCEICFVFTMTDLMCPYVYIDM